MADEVSEAAGPQPEQAYLAREGTDPEPTSEEAPERAGEEPAAHTGPDAEARRPDDESPDRDDEPEGAAEEPDR